MSDQFYLCRDLYFSALLYAKRVPLEKAERDGKTYWFYFEDKEKCEQIYKEFFGRKVLVNARDYVDAVNALRDIIFQ